MGAINYGTSTYLCSLGYNLNNDAADYDDAQDDERWTADGVQEYLNDICLSFYKIDLLHGYYEGFYIDVRGDYYADDEDKEERAKELHKIGRALIYLVNKFELVSYEPGWRTVYAAKDSTIRMIKKAVKREITAIYNTPANKFC